jgi:hypothetical protein
VEERFGNSRGEGFSSDLLSNNEGETHKLVFNTNKKRTGAGRWWLTPVILATQEAEIRRIGV